MWCSSAPSAEQMLMSKMQDPIGATIGGYALLKLNELERIHDWADNLCRWFEWLPDGAVIAAETAGRRGEDDHAQELALTAVEPGDSLVLRGIVDTRQLGSPGWWSMMTLLADAREHCWSLRSRVLSLSADGGVRGRSPAPCTSIRTR